MIIHTLTIQIVIVVIFLSVGAFLLLHRDDFAGALPIATVMLLSGIVFLVLVIYSIETDYKLPIITILIERQEPQKTLFEGDRP